LEFGEDARKQAVIVCVLYGLKSARAALCTHLVKHMWLFGYKLCNLSQNLGAKVRPMTMANDVVFWGISVSQYVQEGVHNQKKQIDELNMTLLLPKVAVNLFPMEYEVETNVSPKFGPELASFISHT